MFHEIVIGKNAVSVKGGQLIGQHGIDLKCHQIHAAENRHVKHKTSACGRGNQGKNRCGSAPAADGLFKSS